MQPAVVPFGWGAFLCMGHVSLRSQQVTRAVRQGAVSSEVLRSVPLELDPARVEPIKHFDTWRRMRHPFLFKYGCPVGAGNCFSADGPAQEARKGRRRVKLRIEGWLFQLQRAIAAPLLLK